LVIYLRFNRNIRETLLKKLDSSNSINFIVVYVKIIFNNMGKVKRGESLSLYGIK